MTVRTLRVDALARVEGEGALTVRTRGDVVEEVTLDIFEPPRFFEGLLRGRAAVEAPDITARICGICPVAYQMSAVHAVERAAGVDVGKVEPALRALRRLLYCGEWIESHVLHMTMLHAPDFLGVHDVVAIAKQRPELVRRGLSLKKAGNRIVQVLGGREIHPINVKVGGFYRVPTKEEAAALAAELRAVVDVAEELVDFVAGLPMPQLHREVLLVSLVHPDEYPMNEGRIVCSGQSGSPLVDVGNDGWDQAFEERHVPPSTALHAVLKATGSHYLTGPLARFAHNRDRLSPRAAAAATRSKLPLVVTNPFLSIVVRGVEVLHALETALAILDAYAPPSRPSVDVPLRAGEPRVGSACTEAPRGLLAHRYVVDDEGLITEARIVAPTSQNQGAMEDDLRALVPTMIDADDDTFRRRCEHAIRNHDPCISCATHFLTLRRERR